MTIITIAIIITIIITLIPIIPITIINNDNIIILRAWAHRQHGSDSQLLPAPLYIYILCSILYI